MLPLSRGRVAAAGVAVLVAALSACNSSGSPKGSSGTTGDAALAHPSYSVSAAPTIGTLENQTMPIDSYLMTNSQRAEVTNAVQALEARCMQRFGFSWAPPQQVVQSSTADLTGSNVPNRYGVDSLSTASQFGFHNPHPAGQRKAGQAPLTSAGMLVLTGSTTGMGGASGAASQSYNGQAVPKGGCLGQATRQINPSANGVNDDSVATGINASSLTLSQKDPKVKAVFAKWSACMAKAGYTYATPENVLNDDRWNTAAPSSAEIQTAEADVRCQQQYNVIGVWFTADSAIQRADIDADATHLQAVRSNIAATVKRAEDALDQG